MDNQELLSQIAEMFTDQAKIIDEQKKATTDKLHSIEAEIKAIRIDMENDIAKRIDALFDGYKLTHEMQWELERKLEALEKRIERLEIA